MAALVVLAVPAVTSVSKLLQSEHEVAFAAGERLEVEEPPPGQTVEVPPRGQARGATFDNGTPVLVVHRGTGDVHVFDARSPVSDEGRRGQLGWCREGMSARLFDPITERQWKPDGTPVIYRSVDAHPGGEPRGRAMQLYAYEVQGDSDGRVAEVGEPRRLEAESSILTGEGTTGDGSVSEPESCAPGEVVSPPPPGEFADVMELEELSDGAYRVTAALEQVGDDPARLCPIPEDPNHLRALLRPPRPDLPLPLCGDETVPVPGSEVARLPDDPNLAHVRVGEFSASVEDGAIDTLLVPASNMRPRSVPVDGEVVLAGSLTPAGPDRSGGPPSAGPAEPDGNDIDYYDPSPPKYPVPLHPLLVDEVEGDAHVEPVGLTTHQVVAGPDWFALDSPYAPGWVRPDFWLPLAPDAEITVRGESLYREELVTGVENGDLKGHEVTVTIDRASGYAVEVQSRDG